MKTSNLLRVSLRLDALVSAAFGALLLLAGPVLTDLLGAPLALLWPVGAVALAYAVGLWVLERQPRVAGSAAWTVIALNAAWAAASVLLLVLGGLPLTGLGIAFVLLQALIVAGFADLQFLGLRRSAPWPGATTKH
jgi:hypothetical protein